MILLIALGVAGTVSSFLLLRAVSANAFASKSHRLFTPQIDSHGPEYMQIAGALDPVLTLRDVEALRASDGASRKTAIYPVNISLLPSDPSADPLAVKGYAVNDDFFRMLDVPFRTGGAWSKESDDSGGNVVVIGAELSRKLFHGGNGLGQEVRL